MINCNACKNIRWWCRGCNDDVKLSEMIKSGMTSAEVQYIYSLQLANCNTPFVPCYLCNRYGKIPYYNPYQTDTYVNSTFWNNIYANWH